MRSNFKHRKENCKMLELNKIYNMDCVQGMKLLDDCSVDLTVTSPPYDNLRKYEGFEWDFEATAKELFRITKQGGVVVWVINDATINGSESGTSFKQALYFKEVGFRLHDTMIFLKSNPVPMTHNRYEQQFEYMFVLSKGKPETFNPLTQPCKTAGKTYNIKRNRVYDGNSQRHFRDEELVTSATKYKYNVWEYSVGTDRNKSNKHPAIFPEQLAQDHIISWSNPNDIILDPFMGSGTTAKMAKANNRNYIGFELSKEYCQIAEQRLLTE